ncbi:MAG TPA: hypothetical protein VJ784_05375 [Pyrinomonadaceae bacterium]|nr:hypothetical protein [Pyrinomonadaceae bacterium]
MSRKLSNHGSELPIKFFVRFQHLPKSDEGSHDHDVYFNGVCAIKNTRQHGDTINIDHDLMTTNQVDSALD